MQVRLKDILEGLEMQSEEYHSYLNIKTGEIISVTLEVLGLAEDCEDFDDIDEWQQDEFESANDIIDNPSDYAQFPTKFDINEYDMMEHFCFSLADNQKQDILLNAIKGKGAFGRFRDNVDRLNLTSQWYDFRDERYKEIAREFCRENQIEFIE